MDEPANPAAPAEGGEPAAPATPAVDPAAPAEPTAEEAAQQAEDGEWDDAAKELFPGLKTGKKKEEPKDEPAEPKKGEEEKPADKKDAKKDEGKKDPADDPAKPDDNKASEEDDEPDTTARDTRLAQREAQQQVEAVKSDVRAKMFANVPQVLQDRDGDPIRSIDDVMKLINPRTNEVFTEEEAGMWLLSAQQQFNQNIASIEKQIDQIAEVNVDLKDQADSIAYEFGELLKAMPELRDEIWADYEATLVKDPESGIIIKAPVSLQRFYARALKPYVETAAKLEAAEAKKGEEPADPKADPKKPEKTAEEIKAEEEAAKKKKRADRSDIFGGTNQDTDDPEDKEWADAATTVFGPKVTKK